MHATNAGCQGGGARRAKVHNQRNRGWLLALNLGPIFNNLHSSGKTEAWGIFVSNLAEEQKVRALLFLHHHKAESIRDPIPTLAKCMATLAHGPLAAFVYEFSGDSSVNKMN